MESCSQHSNQKIEFVCLDKLCKSETCFACFSCVRTIHQKCSDETLLELEEFLEFDLHHTNHQPLSKEIMNRTNIDLRRALGVIRRAFLKKKDLLVDFMGLTQRDFIEHMPRIHLLYANLLLFDHLPGSASHGDQSKVTVSSKFRFKAPDQVSQELEDRLITDFKHFMAQLMDLKDCYLEPILPDQARHFQFASEQVEVSLVEDRTNVLEFYSKAQSGSGQTGFVPGEAFTKGTTQKASSDGESDPGKEIKILSSKQLRSDATWK